MSELEDMRVIVTGGGAGIGQSVVGHLLANGAAVAALDVAIQGVPPGAVAIECDVSDDGAESIERSN